jgi:hypothetical protein
MKVVINRCFGGFGLSDEAFEALLERKGIEYEKGDSTFGGVNYYAKGHVGDDDYYLSHYEHYEPRNDADLIAVVEQFGEKANGWAADLKVVDIPDDVEWLVDEYDGIEHIAEKHRTWY